MRPGQSAPIDVDAFRAGAQGRVDSLAAGTGASFSLLPPTTRRQLREGRPARAVRIRLVHAPAELALRTGLSANVTVDVR